MPQLDVSTFASQIFWLIIAFSFLYVMVARRILPGIHEVLENRRRQLTNDLDRAEKLRKEAESVRQEYEHLLAKSRHDASNIVHKAMQDVADKSAQRHARLDETLAKQIAESEVRLKESRKKVVDQLEPVAVAVTADIIQRLLNNSVDESAIKEEISSRVVH